MSQKLCAGWCGRPAARRFSPSCNALKCCRDTADAANHDRDLRRRPTKPQFSAAQTAWFEQDKARRDAQREESTRRFEHEALEKLGSQKS